MPRLGGHAVAVGGSQGLVGWVGGGVVQGKQGTKVCVKLRYSCLEETRLSNPTRLEIDGCCQTLMWKESSWPYFFSLLLIAVIHSFFVSFIHSYTHTTVRIHVHCPAETK